MDCITFSKHIYLEQLFQSVFSLMCSPSLCVSAELLIRSKELTNKIRTEINFFATHAGMKLIALL